MISIVGNPTRTALHNEDRPDGPLTDCERDIFLPDVPNIPLSAIVAGVGAMAAYADESGCIPNASVSEAFEDGLRAALMVLKIVDLGDPYIPLD